MFVETNNINIIEQISWKETVEIYEGVYSLDNIIMEMRQKEMF